MNFTNKLIIDHLEKALSLGFVLHGTRLPHKKLLPKQLRELGDDSLLYPPSSYQEKAVHATFHIPSAVLYAVLGLSGKHNFWGITEVSKKSGRKTVLIHSESLHMHSGHILILPSASFRLTRDRISLSSKLPVKTIRSVSISPSILESWIQEKLIHVQKINVF